MSDYVWYKKPNTYQEFLECLEQKECSEAGEGTLLSTAPKIHSLVGVLIQCLRPIRQCEERDRMSKSSFQQHASEESILM